MKISKKIRLAILKALLSEQDLFGEPIENINIIYFLDRMFGLKSLPSVDPRFKNAYDDAIQHLVNNNDWDYEYVFTNRFNIVDDHELFLIFLNNIVHPTVRKDEDNIRKYLLLINPYLEKERLHLSFVSYTDEGLPIYEVTLQELNKTHPPTIVKNTIPFFINNYPTGNFHHKTSHKTPTTYPCFVLVNNSKWNDYGNRSTYYLFYYTTNGDCISIAPLKIIHKEIDNTPNVLSESFTTLSESYCSLGLEFGYYEKIKSLFNKTYDSIFWALKDVAIYPEILDEFESLPFFKSSLIRYDEHEQLLREAKFRLYDYNLKNLYSFKYSFKPNFAEEPVDVHFDFDPRNPVPSRIFAIIGKNGTGKTQLLTSLPIDISKKNNGVFIPKTPLFSKLIAVSYSAFDSFEVPAKTVDFNYLYCGLKDAQGELYTETGLKLRFIKSCDTIIKNRRFEKWRNLLTFFLENELISEFVVEGMGYSQPKINLTGFSGISKKLSSGQSILLYIVTEIVANIRYDSLIIYDEPETHLHPNVISQLINSIYELTTEFQSYCILATHSPIIVRELLSRNVYIIEKEENVVSIRKPIIETFGENLTTITEEIFGTTAIPNQYKTILQKLVRSGKSYDDIISIISSDNIPLSLNTRIYLKTIINEESEYI